MKTLIALLAVLLFFLPVELMAQDDHGGNKTFHVQAWDFSDDGLGASKGDPCAAFLAYLMGSSEKYKLLEATGVQGPPGVAYTLINNKGEIAIVKCGTSGCGSGEDGHDSGEH